MAQQDPDLLASARRVQTGLQKFWTLQKELEARRATLRQEIDKSLVALERRAILLQWQGEPLAKVLPMTESESSLLTLLQELRRLPPSDSLEDGVVDGLLASVAESVRVIERPAKRVFASQRSRGSRERAIEFLRWVVGWHGTNQIGVRAHQLEVALAAQVPPPTRVEELLAPLFERRDHPGSRGTMPQFLDGEAAQQAAAVLDDLRSWVATIADSRERTLSAARALLEAELGKLLHLKRSPGDSGTEARRTLWLTVAGETWQGEFDRAIARVDAVERPSEAVALLRQLASWEALLQLAPSPHDQAVDECLAPLVPALTSATGAIVIPAGGEDADRLSHLADEASNRQRKLQSAFALARPDSQFEPWNQLEERLGTYQRLLREVGFELWVDTSETPPLALDQTACGSLLEALETVSNAEELVESARAAACDAGVVIRRAEADRLVGQMPVDQLRNASDGRVRVAPLVNAGINTVGMVLEWQRNLEFLPGMGEASAGSALSAALSIWHATLEEIPVRIDIMNRTAEATNLLARMAEWDAIRKARPRPDELEVFEKFGAIQRHLAVARGVIVMPDEDLPEVEFRRAAEMLLQRSAALRGGRQDESGCPVEDPWDDFLARPADYFTMLAELGFALEDQEKLHGDLPEEIVDAIRLQELHTDHLQASLRGYQAFAARFALVQRKVVIGDEMGLGKTIEALAVLAHLRASGSQHFIVICPAAVVTNWVRETASKSTLRPYRLHGSARDQEARNWVRAGGVAVTTFDSLGWFERLPDNPEIACVVVDEAHYIKNPQALRTQRAVALLDASPRAMLLTGTPLENRVEEFRNLASYIRPDLTVDASDFAPKRFRRQIAPAYLRRNQEDVLAELPDLIEIEEWLPLGHAEMVDYERAVNEGSFHAMRRAVMLAGRASQKVQRLLEIVEEAEANARRVIVFSYYLDVLNLLAELVPGEVMGPITGSVPAAARQQIVDAFGVSDGGTVLLAQIVAAGQGLNIQAASVVVICEPQVKPTLEAQAIARAHRMGQVRSVQVHRLLSEEGVDRRLVEILSDKRRLFDEFARDSEMVAVAPEALEVTEAALARQVVAEERERLSRAASR